MVYNCDSWGDSSDHSELIRKQVCLLLTCHAMSATFGLMHSGIKLHRGKQVFKTLLCPSAVVHWQSIQVRKYRCQFIMNVNVVISKFYVKIYVSSSLLIGMQSVRKRRKIKSVLFVETQQKLSLRLKDFIQINIFWAWCRS